MAQPVVREAQTHAELQACVELQVSVWGFAPRDAVPFNQLHVAHTWGGRVFVAVDGDRVVGFCYGLAGRQQGGPALLSHMLGVLPEYRGRGLGARLKLAQGHWAREQGYDLITWTYDPLEARNANLNINRLGGFARRYLADHYGEMADELNRGLPTDRLLLEWHLHRPGVAAVLDGGSSPEPPAAARSIAIPANFQALKEAEPAAARRVRMQVREAFQDAFAAGLAVKGFRTGADEGRYLLASEG